MGMLGVIQVPRVFLDNMIFKKQKIPRKINQGSV